MSLDETQKSSSKRFKIIVLSILALALLLIYGWFDPSTSHFFPKCPVKSLTHYDCPGCGSQRAIHALLNFEFRDAFRQNALLVLALPYLALGVVFNLIKKPSENMMRWRNRLFGHHATLIVLGIVIAFAVLRNVF
ncbi:MAG: DUF2752 domain-containing protein [Bacteroidota bacterium]